MKLNRIVAAACLAACVMAVPLPAFAQVDPTMPLAAAAKPAVANDPTSLKTQATIDKALGYLKSKQKPDFSWHNESEPPALTAIVLKCFMQDSKYDADQDFLEKAYAKLISYQQPNGGIYKDMVATYSTAISASAIAAAKEAEYKGALDKAVAFLKSAQWSDNIQGLPDINKAVDASDPNFGGWGYGKKGRADGSNTQIALDALHDAGIPSDDPAYKNALKFISRMQNSSETNDQKWAGNDGGAVYTPAGGSEKGAGESFAGEYTTPDGKRMLRSYGSMTYAMLKSFIYAGLAKDDARVKAAWDWINKNYTIEENPGMREAGPESAKSGLYYYYMTMARALHAYGEPKVTDAQGKAHDWRAEFVDKIASLQNNDGSWVGDKKWMEDNPILTTSYVILSLQEVQKDLQEHPAKLRLIKD